MIAEGADIEILDTRSGSDRLGTIVPNSIRINGEEVLIPADANVEFGPLDHKNMVTVRLTMYVRSVSIRRSDPSMTVSDYMDKAQG